MNTPLIIYKASAGSGKTFTLATEYIKLVVDNPTAYKQILAVTFTNKATEEMKQRILSQLYGIWKQLDSSRQYTNAICRELEASPAYVSHQAGIALANLLHNYSFFRINTIDTFFQSVLRNLARELDLTANLKIGLNDVQVEEMAVDELIENLSARDHVLQWILKYVMENISDDKSWNIIGQVKQFGKTLFKDFYKAESRELYRVTSQPRFFEDYTKELRAIRAKSENRMKELAARFFEELECHNFDITDLSYGKNGVAGLFFKLSNGVFDDSIIGSRVTDCIGQPEKWYKKTHAKAQELKTLAEQRLIPLLQQVVDERPEQWKLFKSADLTLRHLNQLRLLESIESKVRDLNDTANRFLLSDTQQLLHDLIDHSDSPFIFEKIGSQLEHIMIDEFQDTSTVQWQNFKVLLQEAMSHAGTENLIVGDVKQSIYRWRSGDWRLLANIEMQFPPTTYHTETRTLDTNYRSDRRIVEFNNVFFSLAADSENIYAYTDVVQKVPLDKPDEGYVCITLLPSADYHQNVLSELKQEVSNLMEQGIPFSSIAILVRTNNLIPLIANYFMEQMPEVPLVSDEAFRLDASPAILAIIHAMRLLIHPSDNIAKAYLLKMSTRIPLHLMPTDSLLSKVLTDNRDQLLRLPIYELTERLCSILQLQHYEGQSAYLFAFFDQVATFVNEHSTDITAFLEEWDENICSMTIQSPDINGIRLISIHKSKGLEFPHVIIPFCDWKLEHSDILWCKPSEEPFNRLPFVPIDYSTSLKGTIYEANYNEEHRQNIVDNMNLLYVAFTRASESLHVIGRRGDSTGRSALIEQIIQNVAENLSGATIEGLEHSDSLLCFTFGNFPKKKEAIAYDLQSDKRKNIFLQESHSIQLKMETYSQKTEFRQSNDSLHFATAPDDDKQQQAEYIKLGNILHNVFAQIHTTNDIDRALQRMELDGILYDRNITFDNLQHMIRKRLEDPRVASWYDEKWTLYNECTIIYRNQQTGEIFERRPDRVMTDGKRWIVVDFKFGHPREDYRQQVKSYMELLTSMGCKNITGYLWYVYSNQIQEVK